MSAKVLILSASVGAGHLRAAEAVEMALREVAPDALVRNIDVLTLTNPVFRRVYGEAYFDLVNRAPHLLGYFYDYMDRPRPPKSRRDQFRLLLEKLNLSRVIDLIRKEHWDIVVNTHFLPAEIIASLRRSRKISVRQITVTTDFETHRLWVNSPCDLYCTATAEGAQYLAHFGVDPDTVHVTGIPIHPLFTQHRDAQTCRADLGLATDRPIVLQLAGGFGVGPIAKLFEGILEIPTPLQIVVVAGKNASVQRQLKNHKHPAHHKVEVLGFTDRMDELMAAADIVVTKPGGLTSSEILARGAAMAIVNPIPGQESRNSDYLLENGAAIKINNVGTLPYKLGQLLADRPKLARLKTNARRVARPRAAFDVARLALDFAAK